jgi:hypothetical protein
MRRIVRGISRVFRGEKAGNRYRHSPKSCVALLHEQARDWHSIWQCTTGLYFPNLVTITPMIVPPIAPMPTIGPYAFVMMASGTLSSNPKVSPTAHPGHGKRAAPIAKPIPKRAMNAAVIAACLSGNLIGSMIPMSTAPKTNPQITPRRILDMSPFCNLRRQWSHKFRKNQSVCPAACPSSTN